MEHPALVSKEVTRVTTVSRHLLHHPPPRPVHGLDSFGSQSPNLVCHHLSSGKPEVCVTANSFARSCSSAWIVLYQPVSMMRTSMRMRVAYRVLRCLVPVPVAGASPGAGGAGALLCRDALVYRYRAPVAVRARTRDGTSLFTAEGAARLLILHVASSKLATLNRVEASIDYVGRIADWAVVLYDGATPQLGTRGTHGTAPQGGLVVRAGERPSRGTRKLRAQVLRSSCFGCRQLI